MSLGFTDLRLNRENALSADNFWPSFTDVMTVVVMVFMTVSTVVVLRNSRLVQQLQDSIAAEARSSLRATSAEEAKLSIEEQLARARRQLELLSQELTATTAAEQQRAAQLAESEEKLSVASRRITESEASLEESRKTGESAQARVLALESEQAKLKEAYAQRESEVAKSAEQIKTLDTLSAQQLKEIEALKASGEKSEKSLSELQEEFGSLKVKYDKLIRPARSTTGKVIAEVRYEKIAGRSQIRYKGPQDPAFSVISRANLEEKLAALQAKDPKTLYIKVVIPEDSGLSYNEAWTFTLELLNKYDYYYR